MRKIFLLLALWIVLGATSARAMMEDSLRVGRFGMVRIYRETDRPARVVLFVSGDGGWNLGVVDMARALAKLDALVAGIDVRRYSEQLRATNEPCSYPASDFEMLSKIIQKKYGFPEYVTPILAGYSSGATLVYATLVQAPATTFKGALSLGFCPDLPWLNKPLCSGSGLEWRPGPRGQGYSFLPAPELEPPWIAFQGLEDKVCNPDSTNGFVKRTGKAKFVALPKVGHGFAVQANWMSQFKQAFGEIAEVMTASAPSNVLVSPVNDLPLELVSASHAEGNIMAVHLTGDGGWGVTDKGLSADLAGHGIPVVALNSLHYFWKARTPDSAAKDLERILRHYLAVWHKERIMLIGYSFGADVLPFMINRLSPEMRDRVDLVVFLGLGKTADFEFHLSDWLGGSLQSLPVAPELRKLRGLKMICFYGAADHESLCSSLEPGLVETVELKGGHRIGGNFSGISDAILAAARIE